MHVNDHIKAIKLSIRKISELASTIPGSIRFDIGQPDFDTPKHIKDAAKIALDRGKTGYSPMEGIPELRSAIVQYEAKKGVHLTPEHIMVTNGGMGALFTIFLGMLEPGDEVILPDPHWAAYRTQLAALKLKAKIVPYYKDGMLNEQALRDAITAQTKMLLVNSPTNPTGEILSESVIKKLAEIAKEHNLTVISDEVYEALNFTHEPCVSIAKYLPKQTIQINSVSKTYAMTGWRLGWLTAPIDVITELKKCNRVQTSCVNNFAQYGAVAALTGDQSCVEEMRKEYEKRYHTIKQRVTTLGWEFPEVRGAFYIFPKTEKDSWTYAMDLLEKAKVATVPGEAFGPSGKTSLRLCFGSVNSDQINEGFDRIEKFEGR